MITDGLWFVSEKQVGDWDQTYWTVGPFEIEHKGASHYEDTICEVWGENHDGESNAKAISIVPELIDIAKRVVKYFEGTDAPIYLAAKAALEKAGVNNAV